MINFIKKQLEEYSWITHITVRFLGCLFLSYVIYMTYKKMRKKFLKFEHFIFNAFLESLYIPIMLFIWLSLIFSSLETLPIVNLSSYKFFYKYLSEIHKITNVLLLGFMLLKFIKKFEILLIDGLVKSRWQDQTTIHAVSKVSRIITILILSLIALPEFGVKVSGLVAFGGGSAIIVAIAGKQIFENYLGGLIIYSDRHFRVGDWIYSPDKNIEGIIESIGWRTTAIRTFDKRALFLPNSIFSSIITINASKMTNWRISEIVYIRYEDIDHVDKITADIQNMLFSHPGIDKTQNFMASLQKLSDYSLEISITAFTETTDRIKYREVLQDLLIKVYRIIKNSGAEVAIPIQIGLNKNSNSTDSFKSSLMNS